MFKRNQWVFSCIVQLYIQPAWFCGVILADVVVELPQSTEDDLRRSRAVRGRRTSYSRLMHVCS